jgi:hypothetical protein
LSQLTIEDYIKSNIIDFRKRYDFSEIPEDSFVSKFLLTKPCQVVALKFDGATILIIFRDDEAEDMDIKVFVINNYTFFSISDIISETPLKRMTKSEITAINAAIANLGNYYQHDVNDIGIAYTKKVGLITISNTLLAYNRLFSDNLIDTIRRTTQRAESEKKIHKTVVKIKRDAEEIPASEVREKILSETTKLEQEMTQLKKKLDEEIDGVRKIIGNSSEFQDFRVFSSDVSDLKKSHVPKEVFESKINELNTRIDSFNHIREGYDNILSQQNEFMKQQSDVIRQQASFMTWLKYATVLLPIAVISVPVIEIIRALLHL